MRESFRADTVQDKDACTYEDLLAIADPQDPDDNIIPKALEILRRMQCPRAQKGFFAGTTQCPGILIYDYFNRNGDCICLVYVGNDIGECDLEVFVD